MKQILITGASGFIGSYMVERALREGYEVWAAVRKTSSRAYLQNPRIHFIELNLGNDESLIRQLETHRREHGPFDATIHAAGATKCRRAEDFYRVNTDGTLRLARTLIETGALKPGGRFLFISSLSVFGPVREQSMTPITESLTPMPNTAYGRSKLQAEQGLAQISGLNYVILRPTGVYGPREKDYFMMARSIKQHVDFAVGYRPQILTFIYIDDLVQAAFLALNRGDSGRAYFLTDGDNHHSRAFSDLLQRELGVRFVLHLKAPLFVLRVISFIVERIARLFGKSATLNGDKYHIMAQRNWQADIEPARRELGYAPQWPLHRGVKAAIAWYKQAGWL